VDKSNFEDFTENELSKLLSSEIVDVEISPYEKGFANFFVKCAAIYYRKPMKLEETFQIVESLIKGGFIVVSSGKEKLKQEDRYDEMYGSLNTWFILAKANK
jgi:hypothetical protein